MPQDVADLIAAAQDGDRGAFDELVRRTYADTYTLAYRLTGNEEDARDVAQEAYLRAYRAIKRFRGDAQFSTWLYRITANHCKNRIKYVKTCPIHGEVSQDQIVSGYEYSKDQYVIVDPAELEKLRTEDDKAIKIDVFIDPADLDPLYYSGKSYYLVPEGPVGQKAGASGRFQHPVIRCDRGGCQSGKAEGDRRRELLEVLAFLGTPGLRRQ